MVLFLPAGRRSSKTSKPPDDASVVVMANGHETVKAVAMVNESGTGVAVGNRKPFEKQEKQE